MPGKGPGKIREGREGLGEGPGQAGPGEGPGYVEYVEYMEYMEYL